VTVGGSYHCAQRARQCRAPAHGAAGRGEKVRVDTAAPMLTC